MGIAEDIIGTHYRYPDYFEVDREKIREFARAVKDDHPAHFTEEAAKECGHDALIASLTFMAVAGRRVQQEIFNQFDLPINMERVLHRDQKLVFHRPILAGDKLWFDSYLDSVTESHGAVLTEVRGEVTDDNGEPVITSIVTVHGRSCLRRRGRRDHRKDGGRARRCCPVEIRCWAKPERKRELSRGTCCGDSPTADRASAGWSRAPGRSTRR